MIEKELKEILRDYGKRRRAIIAERKLIEENERTITSIRSPVIDGMPHATPADGDKIGEAVCRLEELNAKSRAKIAKLTALCTLGRTLIDACELEEGRTLLILHYCNNVPFIAKTGSREEDIPHLLLMSESSMWRLYRRSIKSILRQADDIFV